MAINNIDELCLYTYLKPVHLEGPLRQPSFPMIVLIDRNNLIAAIKIGLRDAWHIENVHAVDGYGPTIYKALMEVSGQHGIAPTHKNRKEDEDFVVPKSRNIWRIFSEAPAVETSFLEEKYSEDYMNLRFISVLGELDISRAKHNFRKHIKNEYRRRVSCVEKIKGLFDKKHHAKAYKQFRHNYERLIWSSAHTFLEASVEAHR